MAATEAKRSKSTKTEAKAAIGIIGGSAMLLLLVYPLRKRVPSLAFIGSVKHWFQFHMVLGVAGPLCILYHSNFSLGVINSNAVLFAMLIVSASGIVGRYFYARIHCGLAQHCDLQGAGEEMSLRNFRAQPLANLTFKQCLGFERRSRQ